MTELRITKIEKQTNASDRYSLYVDNEFWMGVSGNVLVKYGLVKSQDISQNELKAIQLSEWNDRLYQRAIRFLSSGMKTEWEVEKKLQETLQKFEALETEEQQQLETHFSTIISKLKEQGYINDLEYSQSYVRTYSQLSLKGPKALEQALKSKGIDAATIQLALLEYPEKLQLEYANKCAAKVVKQHKSQPPKKIQEKAYQYLITRGYSSDIIRTVLDQIQIEVDEEEQLALIEKEATKQVRRLSKKHRGYPLKQKLIETLLRKRFEYDLIQQWLAENEELWE